MAKYNLPTDDVETIYARIRSHEQATDDIIGEMKMLTNELKELKSIGGSAKKVVEYIATVNSNLGAIKEDLEEASKAFYKDIYEQEETANSFDYGAAIDD